MTPMRHLDRDTRRGRLLAARREPVGSSARAEILAGRRAVPAAGRRGDHVAPISPEEFEALMAIVRAPPAEPVLTPAGRWRKEYREAQRRLRIVGVQHDLFDAPAKTHYYRHAPQASFARPAIEGIEAKMQRIAGDPLATFGPVRQDRPTYLSDDEKAAIVHSAANWLHLGQRVQIVDGPTPVDPSFGSYRYIGRKGVVYRLCSPVFADRVYVFLDPVGAERAEKIAFLEIRDLIPIADEP